MDNISKSAFAPYLQGLETAAGHGLEVKEWTVAGIAAVMARPDGQDAATQCLADFATTHGAMVLNIGPAQWLLIAPQGGPAWHDALDCALGGSATHFDQSAGFGLLALSGSKAGTVLQKGLFVDLDVALAVDGANLASMIAHVPVIACRTAPDAFLVAVPRSYVGSFWHWLEAAATAEAIKPTARR